MLDLWLELVPANVLVEFMEHMRSKTPAGALSAPDALTRKVELLPINELLPYRRNARLHSTRQIQQIAASIERFGFTNPILIDKQNKIVAGHGRWKAAKRLALTLVPVIRLEHLTDVEARAYLLVDNKLPEQAEWDREVLALELQGLIELDFDLGSIGFATAEIDLLLEEVDNKSADRTSRDTIPTCPTTAVTQPGDLWQLGPHALLCADARTPNAYSELLNGTLADMIIADPTPAMACGELTRPAFTDFLQAVFNQLVANSLNGSIHYVFTDWRNIPEVLIAGEKTYSEIKDLCVWNKGKPGRGSFYRAKHELVLVLKSGGGPHTTNFETAPFGRTRTNVWDYASDSIEPARLDGVFLHTIKPVALLADAIKDCSRRGGTILDPFVGTGTTIIAAEQTGRMARAIELDPKHVDVAVRRWQAFTGKHASNARTGLTFEDQRATFVSQQDS